MRRWMALTGVVALSVLGLAGVALAASTQVAHVTLTAHLAGQSTGITSDVRSSDPTAPGEKPKSARTLTITFPAATKFNFKTHPVKTCTLTDKQLTAAFGPSCPRQTQIGTGSAVANASPLAQTVKAHVRAYVGGANEMLIVITPTSLPGAATIVVRAAVSGSKVTIPVPQPVLGKSKGFSGVTVALVSLKLDVPALGSGRSALITAGRCTGHRFLVTEHFVYRDHATLDLHGSLPCR
jgi:hypothetical protein